MSLAENGPQRYLDPNSEPVVSPYMKKRNLADVIKLRTLRQGSTLDYPGGPYVITSIIFKETGGDFTAGEEDGNMIQQKQRKEKMDDMIQEACLSQAEEYEAAS